MVMDESNLIVIKEYDSINEAEWDKSLLDGAGIYAMIRNEYMSTLHSWLCGPRIRNAHWKSSRPTPRVDAPDLLVPDLPCGFGLSVEHAQARHRTCAAFGPATREERLLGVVYQIEEPM